MEEIEVLCHKFNTKPKRRRFKWFKKRRHIGSYCLKDRTLLINQFTGFFPKPISINVMEYDAQPFRNRTRDTSNAGSSGKTDVNTASHHWDDGLELVPRDSKKKSIYLGLQTEKEVAELERALVKLRFGAVETGFR